MPTLINKLFGEQDVMSIRDQAALRDATEEKKAHPPSVTNYNATKSTALEDAARNEGKTVEQKKREQELQFQALRRKQMMEAQKRKGFAQGGSVKTVQDLRDILASWEGQDAPPEVRAQLSQLEADLNAYDQDNDPTSFRAQSQAQRQADDQANWLPVPEMRESDWAPAFTSHAQAAQKGMEPRRVLSELIASPLIITDAAEMALDAVRGVKSPNRFAQAANALTTLMGGEATPGNRFASDYDNTELAANVFNPINMMSGKAALGGLRSLSQAAKYARKMPLREAAIPLSIGAGAGYATAGRAKPQEFAGGGLARLAARLGKEATPARRGVADVIKEKGGNWLSGSVEGALGGLKRLEPVRIRRGVESPTHQVIAADPINQWIDKPLARYVKNEMATPQDPVRALAERGVLHFDPRANPELAADTDLQPGRRRVLSGFPAAGLGKAPAAKKWEAVSDSALHQASYLDHIPMEASKSIDKRLLDAGGQYAVDNPDALAYAMSRGRTAEDLGFNHLIDELSNAINPESGLPRHLQFPVDRLGKVTVPQAVERVAAINEWRANQKAIADQARANNAATVLHKEYPEQGMKWVELKKRDLPEGYVQEGSAYAHANDPKAPWIYPEDELKDALKYEGDTMGHCVGGYCDDVAAGRSKIYSLRDAKGQPHVTIEISPSPKADVPDAYPHIVQIKGKANRAPNPEYLPMVQDFVKSGKWSGVEDLQNTGLQRAGWSPENLEALKSYGIEAPEYGTVQEINEVLGKLNKAKGFAQGGSVKKIVTVQDLRDIIGTLQSGN